MTVLKVGVLVALMGTLAACGSSSSTGCERLKECINDELNVDECTDEVDDAVRDGRLSEDDLERCVDCLDSNSCGEILTGDCDVACDDIEVE